MRGKESSWKRSAIGKENGAKDSHYWRWRMSRKKQNWRWYWLNFAKKKKNVLKTETHLGNGSEPKEWSLAKEINWSHRSNTFLLASPAQRRKENPLQNYLSSLWACVWQNYLKRISHLLQNARLACQHTLQQLYLGQLKELHHSAAAVPNTILPTWVFHLYLSVSGIISYFLHSLLYVGAHNTDHPDSL